MAEIGNIRPNPSVTSTSQIVDKPSDKKKDQRSGNSGEKNSDRTNDDDDKHIDEYA
ncbi:hypothetical protein MNBD_GAMMA21-1201 [hydrothermal vent metagenome]|uniref:Uncharacterized protein n=1 Tax=hydrothermal vent metagenome TaxID=652676 RepID=A0A3B0ZW35_9ZZZZ